MIALDQDHFHIVSDCGTKVPNGVGRTVESRLEITDELTVLALDPTAHFGGVGQVTGERENIGLHVRSDIEKLLNKPIVLQWNLEIGDNQGRLHATTITEEIIMPVNVPLLDATLNHIIQNPKDWNQNEWRCGTSYCFAGWAAVISGWEPVEKEETVFAWEALGYETLQVAIEGALRRFSWIQSPKERIQAIQEDLGGLLAPVPTSSTAVTRDGVVKTIQEAAREALGIDNLSAVHLFDSDNRLDDLKECVAILKKEGAIRESLDY